jgi:hypothetical protein
MPPHSDLIELGEAIGIIAGQSIGAQKEEEEDVCEAVQEAKAKDKDKDGECHEVGLGEGLSPPLIQVGGCNVRREVAAQK